MAAALSLAQLSSGNPTYDKYYRQVDPSGSGRVAATDAAQFLKRSGLTDVVLGKIWDLSDSDRKGSLSKQQFFMALRLVACAQNGLEVAPKSLSFPVPPPIFRDSSSPLSAAPSDVLWVVKPEEKMKFDSIFDSLAPVGGLLSGDQVKPVLLNSKLPVDILGRVWELSDLDRDGMLDRDEFSVAMYLVYRALEGEPVPMSLPPPLVPPSKRKKGSVVPLLPSPPSARDSRPAAKSPAPPTVSWVVPPAEKAKYDELFSKTDLDMDGLVSGAEARDIFLKTGLPSATLARIWELCDMGDMGKLTQEQFALALYLINLKLTKGLDPPQSLPPEMIPPSDRLRQQNKAGSLAADFSAIKELDSLSNEVVELQREKSSVEEDIKQSEEAIRQRSTEVQDLQDEVAKETEELQRLQTQRQKIQEVLDELDQQKSSLEEQLSQVRLQTGQESQLISSLQSEHEEQEQKICQFEEELVQAREELLALQEQSRSLQEKVQAAQEQLSPLQESVQESYSQVAQVQQQVAELRVEERSVTAQLSWKRALEDSSPVMVNGSARPDLSSEELPTDMEETGGAVATPPQNEHPDKEEEQEAETNRADPLDDLFSTLTSTHMYSKLSRGPQQAAAEGAAESGSAADVSSEISDDEDSPKQTPLKVDSPEPDSREPPAGPPQTSSPPLQLGPRSAPPRSSPPCPPEIDFFQSDPFTERKSCRGRCCIRRDPNWDQSDDPFKDDPFGKAEPADLFGADPFKGSDPFGTDSFSSTAFSSQDPFSGPSDPFGASPDTPEPDMFAAQPCEAPPAASAPGDPFTSGTTNPTPPAIDPFGSTGTGPVHSDPFGSKQNVDPFSSQDGDPDPFSCSAPGSEGTVVEAPPSDDPFAPGGTTVKATSDADPFAAVFGSDSFVGGFADFTALTKTNGPDQFGTNNKNLFQDQSQSALPDLPPALPPKTGTPTRAPPPPPGKRAPASRAESCDSFQRRPPLPPQQAGDSSLPAKDPAADPFAPSSPHSLQEADRFASFDKYPTEEDLIEWAKRESEREEKERLARLSQQEQEDLELAIALSRSELS